MNELQDPEILAQKIYEAQYDVQPSIWWNDLIEPMKEIPLRQARRLMELYHIIPKEAAS